MPRGRPKKSKALTEEQIQAIQNLDNAMFVILNDFRFMRYPPLDHMVEFDNAACLFHHLFSEVIHDD